MQCHHPEGCMEPLRAVQSIFRPLTLTPFRNRVAFVRSGGDWMFMMGDDFTQGS